MHFSENIKQEEWDLITNYLQLKDEKEQAKIWNEDLAQIPNIDEKVIYILNVSEQIEDSIRLYKIKEFNKQIPAEKEIPKVRISKKKGFIWYTSAAMIALLIGSIWFINNLNSPERIFNRNFVPDIGLPLKMSAKNNYQFDEGMLDYKQGQYKAAITKWETAFKETPNNDTLNYFLGVANLAIGNSKTSLEYLEKQDHFENSAFTEDAVYYSALAKIKEGKVEEAKILLKNNPSKRSNQLLKELK
ncbi:MAG TPA: tetratricopeptide repeat protein [Edaphocola sp.]|nr:tetratricopeptide repeat protein [Edaphocola sp.]